MRETYRAFSKPPSTASTSHQSAPTRSHAARATAERIRMLSSAIRAKSRPPRRVRSNLVMRSRTTKKREREPLLPRRPVVAVVVVARHGGGLIHAVQDHPKNAIAPE